MTHKNVEREQKVRIVGTDHSSCIANTLKKWFNQEATADVILYVYSQSEKSNGEWIPIRANRCVLSAGSPVFHNIFSSSRHSVEVPTTVHMVGYAYWEVFGLVHFLYLGYCPLWINAQEMLRILYDFRVIEGNNERTMLVNEDEEEERLLVEVESFFPDEESDEQMSGEESFETANSDCSNSGNHHMAKLKQSQENREHQCAVNKGDSTLDTTNSRKRGDGERANHVENCGETGAVWKKPKKEVDHQEDEIAQPSTPVCPVEEFPAEPSTEGPTVESSSLTYPSSEPPTENLKHPTESANSGNSTSGIFIILDKVTEDGSKVPSSRNPATRNGESSVVKHQDTNSVLDSGTDVRYRCGTCNETYVTESDCRQHLKTHTSHRCDICQQTFLQKTLLDSHLQIHMREGLYFCQICDKTFTRKAGLSVHLRSHSKDSKYKIN